MAKQITLSDIRIDEIIIAADRTISVGFTVLDDQGNAFEHKRTVIKNDDVNSGLDALFDYLTIHLKGEEAIITTKEVADQKAAISDLNEVLINQ